MITIQTAVEEIVRKSPYLEFALTEGIINSSSLARKIKPDIEKRLFKTIKLGAITMAINRLESRFTAKQHKLKPLLKQYWDIAVRSNLIEFTFVNSESLIKKQEELLKKIGDKKGAFLTFTQSLFQTTLIISKQWKGLVEEIFQGEKIISNIKDLSAITLTFSQETVNTPGVYYNILKILAWYDINIIEVVSSFTELTIVLNDSQVDQAFSILKN